ncbi:HxlR family transcriptional regulator [Larkinella arboricola]|uniref:HxlR family transcriptional regulator n=1 Tax=Larkinella arboricola TaxID=643671 RepID=A0A327WN78_LARAB|nr:helix-turn-helix domain-containing protein [Larkinella arboricola]RAJ93055.1 HxlR family transcriptional regulator [Larkinella arboricola]
MAQTNRKKIPSELDYVNIHKAVAVISGKWRLFIILLVGEHTVRFGELRQQLPAISEKMLAGELKALVALGVLSRNVYAEIPGRIEYTMTPKGTLALPILRQLPKLGQLAN